MNVLSIFWLGYALHPWELKHTPCSDKTARNGYGRGLLHFFFAFFLRLLLPLVPLSLLLAPNDPDTHPPTAEEIQK